MLTTWGIARAATAAALRPVALSPAGAVRPAWAILGSKMRMPVVTVVMAATSHLRMRQFMIDSNQCLNVRSISLIRYGSPDRWVARVPICPQRKQRPLSRSDWGAFVIEGLSDGRGLVRHEQPGDEVDQDLRAGEEQAGHEGDSDDGGIDVEVAGGCPATAPQEPLFA